MYKLNKTIYREGEGTSPPPPPPAARTFTQDEVNKFIADDRKKLQTAYTQTVEQLETLKQAKGTSDKEREELQVRIDTLNSQFQTKEQQLATERDTIKKKYDTDTKTLAEQANNWKGKFDNLMITNSILSASSTHKAVNPTQMVLMLQGQAQVVEQVSDDGKGTGTYVVKTKVKSKDKDGKVTELDMPIDDAIGEMKKNDDFFNLFVGDDTSGLGGNGNTRKKPGGTSDGFQKGMSMSQFRDLKKRELTS